MATFSPLVSSQSTFKVDARLCRVTLHPAQLDKSVLNSLLLFMIVYLAIKSQLSQSLTCFLKGESSNAESTDYHYVWNKIIVAARYVTLKRYVHP